MSKPRCQYGVNDEVPNGIRSREIVGIHKLLVFLRTSSNPYSSQLQILHDKWCPTCRHFGQCIHLYCTYTPSWYECVSTVNAMLHWWQTEVEGKKWPASHVCFLSAIPCSVFWKKKALTWFGYLVIHSLQYRYDLCVNSNYKSIWNLNASTCKCNQMCTRNVRVCPSMHYAKNGANQKKTGSRDLINSTILIQFWYNSCNLASNDSRGWSCGWDRRGFPTDLVPSNSLKTPFRSSRENFKILDTTWPPAPRIVWWKIVSSGFRSFHVRLRCSHVWPGGNSYGIFAPVDSRLIGGKNFLLPSPILLSHPLQEGLLFQT